MFDPATGSRAIRADTLRRLIEMLPEDTLIAIGAVGNLCCLMVSPDGTAGILICMMIPSTLNNREPSGEDAL